MIEKQLMCERLSELIEKTPSYMVIEKELLINVRNSILNHISNEYYYQDYINYNKELWNKLSKVLRGDT